MSKLNNNGRALGRAIATGTRAQIVSALDRVIEPKNPMWERLSDIALGWVADAIIDSRDELVAGLRQALDEVSE
tara:strand:- start:433 stop:654 length:222 start_codon:yes stop_codon:yes gene_type:complete